MKKTLLASTICAIFAFNASAAHAEPSEEENIGFLAGALSGTLVGGPVGFIIGGITGIVMGEQVGKANQLDEAEHLLLVKQQENQVVSEELVRIEGQLEEQISSTNRQTAKAANWLTQDLTLNLMFTTGSSSLSQNDLQMIHRLSNLLNEYPELNIRLDGHSDARGDEESNMALSKSRTRAVEQAFADTGIDSTRLNIRAHGEAESSMTTNLDDYAMDRRVSINFYTQTPSTVAQN